ncbi:hypothetical protein BEWA_035390 [Theileria equi strain WA]|uniref:Uncharacterized protein n=1 Tax=Theileria equi strain WA TaxID=1537102 RepID=L1LEA8_THEEQ|nr:hypothetical protein BEWA_035390 [Theileria equi strain WA]EKX73503.1 hypothetical protein BEWA_035390 [Theileria equi strain WA]|eukprot:XP_004832955.1 hypothetical protein BEWA_035390 [Theileria equi strain WA]
MFLAKRESKVRKIVDGKNIIWVSDKYHHCTQVLVHLNGMTPALAQITLETRLNTVVLRVRNVCGFWEATPYFAELFVGLKVPSILNVKFPMDIWLREDNEHMRVLYYEIYKVPSIVMVPRTGHNSGKVVDRRRRIWKTKKSKRILCLKLHPSDDPVLLHIVTMSMSGKVKNKYFARQSNGNWEVINKYGYLRMLHDELRAQVLRDTVQDLEEDSEDEEEEEEEEKKKEPEVEEQLLIIL